MRTLVAVIALPLAVAGCGGERSADPPTAGDARPARPDDRLQVDTAGWKTDFSRHSVPLSEFRPGGPPRDGIPPIDKPKFTSVAGADRVLADREPVIAVEAGARARAYPVQILVWHEIVNDRLAGGPIAVTYCPLCNSALVFDRRAAGRTLTFGTTGNLRHSDLVMWDRQTQSWWQQIGGEAVVGKLTGTRLTAVAAQTLSWGVFKRRYPRADVLSRDTGHDRDYGTNPYVSYDRPDVPPFMYSGRSDPRLPPKERVATVTVRGDTIVVPFTALRRRPVAQAQVGGTPVAVLWAPGVASPLDRVDISASRDVGTSGTFDRRLAGRTLDFAPRAGAVTDRQTGSTWEITGRATAGPLSGQRLRPVPHDDQFWFSIAAFLPRARVVEP